MQITKTVTIGLAARGPVMQIGESAVVGDCGSRVLVFELLEWQTGWETAEREEDV